MRRSPQAETAGQPSLLRRWTRRPQPTERMREWIAERAAAIGVQQEVAAATGALQGAAAASRANAGRGGDETPTQAPTSPTRGSDMSSGGKRLLGCIRACFTGNADVQQSPSSGSPLLLEDGPRPSGSSGVQLLARSQIVGSTHAATGAEAYQRRRLNQPRPTAGCAVQQHAGGGAGGGVDNRHPDHPQAGVRPKLPTGTQPPVPSVMPRPTPPPAPNPEVRAQQLAQCSEARRALLVAAANADLSNLAPFLAQGAAKPWAIGSTPISGSGGGGDDGSSSGGPFARSAAAGTTAAAGSSASSTSCLPLPATLVVRVAQHQWAQRLLNDGVYARPAMLEQSVEEIRQMAAMQPNRQLAAGWIENLEEELAAKRNGTECLPGIPASMLLVEHKVVRYPDPPAGDEGAAGEAKKGKEGYRVKVSKPERLDPARLHVGSPTCVADDFAYLCDGPLDRAPRVYNVDMTPPDIIAHLLSGGAWLDRPFFLDLHLAVYCTTFRAAGLPVLMLEEGSEYRHFSNLQRVTGELRVRADGAVEWSRSCDGAKSTDFSRMCWMQAAWGALLNGGVGVRDGRSMGIGVKYDVETSEISHCLLYPSKEDAARGGVAAQDARPEMEAAGGRPAAGFTRRQDGMWEGPKRADGTREVITGDECGRRGQKEKGSADHPVGTDNRKGKYTSTAGGSLSTKDGKATGGLAGGKARKVSEQPLSFVVANPARPGLYQLTRSGTGTKKSVAGMGASVPLPQMLKLGWIEEFRSQPNSSYAVPASEVEDLACWLYKGKEDADAGNHSQARLDYEAAMSSRAAGRKGIPPAWNGIDDWPLQLRSAFMAMQSSTWDGEEEGGEGKEVQGE